ncbi:MAG: TlpA family protein disulfide reductase [Candidatus Odyssella sp.]|nr:TlpA family protein disulfide reductase [Candidatus Odyssella sp.]
MATPRPAPEWRVARWLNAPAPIALADLRGKAVLAVAFQMLCPGCVAHGLPQAMRARDTFSEADLAVVGLHTVFEHHEAQGNERALAAFLHEYRIRFPVGMDDPDPEHAIPATMRAYRMEGTPTTILIDRQGNIRLQTFGHLDDMRLGALIASLVAEPREPATASPADTACGGVGCRPPVSG